MTAEPSIVTPVVTVEIVGDQADTHWSWRRVPRACLAAVRPLMAKGLRHRRPRRSGKRLRNTSSDGLATASTWVCAAGSKSFLVGGGPHGHTS